MKKQRYMLLVLLFSAILFSVPSWADLTKIYENQESKTIAPGVTWQQIQRFTEDGWLNINVLKVDTNQRDIKVDALLNKQTVRDLKTVQELAQENGAVAGINTGFFNWGAKGEKPYPDGPMIQNGKVVSMDSEYNAYSNSMATFSLLSQNKVDLRYWKPAVELIAANGAKVVVGQYNKPSRDREDANYTDWTIWDRAWDSKSMGVNEKYPDLIEIVVENDTVKQIRKQMKSVIIPARGYIILTRAKNEGWIDSNLNVGDKVTLQFTVDVDLQKVKTAVTGSSVLLQKGKIPQPFSYDYPQGRQPRTAIGAGRTGKMLYFVTVDGRQNSSIGMTLKELAEWMKKELKCYTALNLDGGGSTTMVVRQPGTEGVEVVNRPSDGKTRSVLAGMGVFVPASDGQIRKLIVSAKDKRVFVNTERTIEISGVDQYGNQVPLDENQVVYRVQGVKGVVENGRFFPKTAGKATITAKYGDISGTMDVEVLRSTEYYMVEPSAIVAKVGQSVSLQVWGVDKYGYRAEIEKQQWTATLTDEIGSVQKGIFLASSKGEGTVKIAVGGKTITCPVSVELEKILSLDEFEAADASFSGYPSTVQGTFEIARLEGWKDGSVGKLKYSFSTTEGNRAAYINFNNGGLSLPEGSTQVSLRVAPEKASSAWLRMELTDANGQKKVLDVAKPMDFSGWKETRVGLSGIALPAMIKRIYVVQTNPIPEEGVVLFDKLSAVSTGIVKSVDERENRSDQALQETPLHKGGILRMAVLDAKLAFEELQKKMSESSVYNRLQNMDGTIFPSRALIGLKNGKTPEKAIQQIGGVIVIPIDAAKGGIRETDKAQWRQLLSMLQESENTKVIVSLSLKPENFKDPLEAKLLEEVLEKSGKEVWVFYPDEKNRTQMKNGVKWMGVNAWSFGKTASGKEESRGYYEISVEGQNMTYNFIGL